jgi:hypothetical protein
MVAYHSPLLDASSNSVLPDVIFQMTMLRKLDLNFIRMTNLPGEIGQLTNLEVRLSLRYTSFPHSSDCP